MLIVVLVFWLDCCLGGLLSGGFVCFGLLCLLDCLELFALTRCLDAGLT